MFGPSHIALIIALGVSTVAPVHSDIVGQVWVSENGMIPFAARLIESQPTQVAPDVSLLSGRCISLGDFP
jgi:hypothetical protein